MNESGHPIVQGHLLVLAVIAPPILMLIPIQVVADGETKKAPQNSPVLYNRVVEDVDVPPL